MSWIENGSAFLESVSTRVLHEAFISETNVRAKMRLHAALLRRKNKKVEEIADTLEKPKGTISKWLNKLNDNGLQAAMPTKQPGRPKRLTKKQLTQVRKDLLKSPDKLGYPDFFWSTRLVQHHVKKKFKVSFVARHMTRLMHKLGFSSKKPRPQNNKAKPEEWEKFKKKANAWYHTTQKKDSKYSA